jgi:hypothetical protein
MVAQRQAPVPELTRSGAVKLNARDSLQRHLLALSMAASPGAKEIVRRRAIVSGNHSSCSSPESEAGEFEQQSSANSGGKIDSLRT